MVHPDDGLATNKTVREIVSAIEVLGTGDLATEVTLNTLLTKLNYIISLDEITTFVSGDKTLTPSYSLLKVGTEELADRKKVLITNNGAYAIRISANETDDGIIVLTGMSIVLTYSGSLYGKTAEGTFNVNLVEIA